jgi:hypothetical protein
MAYFVFDMDETLGELYSTHYFLSSLDVSLKAFQSYPANIQNYLFKHLQKAYQSFVRQCAEQELSNSPLGVLRPGIIDVMRKLVEAKKKGLINGAIIYSNSGDSFNLQFIKDVLEHIVRPEKIFCDLVDWWHPLRELEKDGRPGSANKTWDVLETILQTGSCDAKDVKPKDVYFFDDKIHEDLLDKLGDHYVHVPEYQYKASVERIVEIFRKALDESGISTNPELTQSFLKSIGKRVSGKSCSTLDELIDVFQKSTRGTASATNSAPVADTQKILDLIDGLGLVATGGFRKSRHKTQKQRRRRATKKSHINRRR